MDDNTKEEEANPENPELPKYIADNIEKEKERGKTQMAIEKQLRSDPKYRQYFKDYTDSSWESFIQHYAFIKSLASGNKELYLRMQEEKELEFYNKAEEALWEIQQKKLFNYQCLWRAEKEKTEHVEVETDFDFWSRNIKCCPFIEPIKDEEFSLYKDFLETNQVDDYFDGFGYTDWQDHYTYKREANGEEETISYPDWYAFYDMRMGTGALMLLPDIRGEKESFYLNLYHENWRATHPQPQAANIDKREYLNYYDYEIMRGFIEKFEDAKTLNYMNAYNSQSVKSDGFEFEMFIHKLCEIKEVLPIEAHYDWRIAITRAYNKYVKGKVIEQLDGVYREYKSRISMGIGFAAEEKDPDRSTRKRIILEARVINGEPPDLNF